MMMRNVSILLMSLCLLVAAQVQAQCPVNINQFQAGETLTYDLYFKWGLVNTKAGISTLTTISQKYNGKDAYKMALTAKSSGMVNKVFSINDTLASYMTKDLIPLAFHKNAEEGGDHTIENMTYTYNPSGGISVHSKRVKNGEQRFDEVINYNSCVYDMISVVFYARTLDFSSMKKGQETRVDFISGKRKTYMIIEYQGTEKMKANDDKTYDCIKLVLSIMNASEKAFEDKEEAMKVYITNDNNRMPVRLDSKLNVGSTRAILKGYKGLKHEVNAK
ncbi:MAG: DUF3108 domain-containing protein [Prevotella sp.]|jgi:hypothetical protein|nr:DUF3108 domain-containing protein [Prevotella sp.]